MIDFNRGDTNLIIETCKKYGLLRNQAAYVLATAWHETAHTMKPVREYGGENYLRKKKYYPYVGMGYVQLTWDYNYKKASAKLGVDFMEDPKLLLKPEYAKEILVVGMKEGWFTGKALDRYITLQKSDFVNARRIINGTDKAALIASHAEDYDNYLKKIGYGATKKEVPVILPSKPVQRLPDDPGVQLPEKPKASPAGLLDVLIRILSIIFGGKNGTK